MPRAALLALTLIACQAADEQAAAPKPAKTDWRTTGPFAAKRAALKTAVETFPADPSPVARCRPDQKGVLVLAYNTARRLYAPTAPDAPLVGTGLGLDVGGKEFFLQSIERAAWETAPPEDQKRWEKPPYEWVTAVALFKPTAVKAPEMAHCRETPAGRSCQMVPGVVDAELVVFDDSGKPTCANKLRIEGPMAALIKSTGKLEEYQRHGLEGILDAFFYYATESPEKDAPWRFLSVHQFGTSPTKRYTVTIDGAVIQTGTES